MRYKYRVTKYDPVKRNQLGHYLAEDWTSISDIGRPYNGQVLTQEEYERIEGAYLDSISAFLYESKVDTLTIEKLELHHQKYRYKVGQELGPMEIRRISQLALREQLWCQLRHPRRAFVHFGYDYYMYIGVSRLCPSSIAKARGLGLFVEPFWSPYLGRLPKSA